MKLVLCSIVDSVRFRLIVEVFDYRTFDCVRLVKCLGEFDYVRLPNAFERLNSIIERSNGGMMMKSRHSEAEDKLTE